MSEAEQIAHFLATRGATKVAVGERTMNWRQMHAAVRGETVSDPINERHIVVDHCGREHVRNGLGEWIS